MTPNDWSQATDATHTTNSTVIAPSPTTSPTGQRANDTEDAQSAFSGHGALSGRRLGSYRLRDLLGVGGMAEVYRARDLARQRMVAVKVLASHLTGDASYVAQFRDEARRAERLRHRHIVPLYDEGEDIIEGQRVLYLVMPLLSRSLSQRLRREGSLPYLEALRLTLEAAAGLQAAHAAGLVHCDVKPGNILLDDEGHALLCDFGVALETGAAASALRQVADTPTSASQDSEEEMIAGTPAYMAPEQLCGAEVDQRADVYSLGVVLYQLLTGQRPFEGETPLDIATHALRDPVIPPSARVPNRALPLGLDGVLLAALARDPRDRFSTMGEFATALRRVRSDPIDSWGVWDQSPAAVTHASPIPGDALMPQPGRFQQERGAPINRARRLLCVAALAASLACAAGLTTMLETWGRAGTPGAAGLSRAVPAQEARATANTQAVITPRTTTTTPTPTPTPTNTGGSQNDDEMVALVSASPPQQQHGHAHGAAKGKDHSAGHSHHPKPEHAAHANAHANAHGNGNAPGKGAAHGHGHGGKGRH